MALGGGFFTAQNKVLPGGYINFVSAKQTGSALSERGVVAVALELDWGQSDEIITAKSDSILKESINLFGYSYEHEKMKQLREIFLNANTVYVYKLNSAGTKASNTYAEAKHHGIRGNDLKLVIKKNVDNSTKFDVITLLDNAIVDVQTVANSAELKANDFVSWKSVELQETAGIPLVGGTNGSITGSAHQDFLGKLESYSINALCCNSVDASTKKLYTAYTKRMRDEVGVKFQTVIYNEAADYEGIVNVVSRVHAGSGAKEHSLVFWVAGIIGSCAVNKSNLNRRYDGEYAVPNQHSQTELEDAIKKGRFVMHKVNDDIRVLEDVNSLVTLTEEKGEDFKSNQAIRVIDQIANDIGALFNTKYLGSIPNDEAGRVSLWADIVKHHEALQAVRAIESFKGDDVKVARGEGRNAVVISDKVQIIGTMAKLYMTVVVA